MTEFGTMLHTYHLEQAMKIFCEELKRAVPAGLEFVIKVEPVTTRIPGVVEIVIRG